MSDEISIFGALPATKEEVRDSLVVHNDVYNTINEKKIRESYGQKTIFNSLNNPALFAFNLFSPIVMYEEPPKDESYRWATSENMAGYEDKYDFFAQHSPRSKEHHDIFDGRQRVGSHREYTNLLKGFLVLKWRHDK